MIRGGGFHAGGLFAASSERIMSDSSGMPSGDAHWGSAAGMTESSCKLSMVSKVCGEKLRLKHGSEVGEGRRRWLQNQMYMYTTVG